MESAHGKRSSSWAALRGPGRQTPASATAPIEEVVAGTWVATRTFLRAGGPPAVAYGLRMDSLPPLSLLPRDAGILDGDAERSASLHGPGVP
jgi:hypothetical protein